MSSQTSRDGNACCSEPMSCITGFVVTPAAQSKRHQRLGRELGRVPSQLTLNLSSSSFGSSKVDDTDSEGAFSLWEGSDDEDDGAPHGIPIVQKDDEHYKMMLRVRAVVNARLYQSQQQAAQCLQQGPQQQPQPRR